jgi:ribonuclease/clavin/mitogillin
MAQPPPTMIGLELPDIDTWSERVVVALGQNPSVFTGPGTNTYLVGTGKRRILLDTGSGLTEYMPVLDRALRHAGCEEIQEIVLTHGHPDHIGGAEAVIERYGTLAVSKRPWAGVDERYDVEITPIDDGSVIETEGATLRALHTPGHAEDHLCFILEQEGSLFSGDNVLGVGTTVIPGQGGSLLDYMNSLERLLQEKPNAIYPAHGPCIPDGQGKLREYIDHRNKREQQIISALSGGPLNIAEVVKVVYVGYPESLHAAAGSSVCSHLLKLESENRVRCSNLAEPMTATWENV